MSEEQAAILRPETLVEEFKKNGVTHIITIPDSETNYLYELMKEQPWLDVIPTSREGETFAIALGLLVGGKVPVCLIQNTGMMESGDSIRALVGRSTRQRVFPVALSMPCVPQEQHTVASPIA